MASSKMMASTSAANPDLPRQSDIHPLSVAGAGVDRRRLGGLTNMDELFKSMYDGTSFSVPSSAVTAADGGSGMSISRQTSLNMPIAGEVWNGFPAGQEAGITLEEFLAKAGAVAEEDVRIPVMPTPGLAYSGNPMVNSVQFQVSPHIQPTQAVPGGFGVDPMGFADGIDGRIIPLAAAAGGSGGGVGRGKRRMDELPMDRATQQKQRRMIKNRESAARSRERKQAYTIELESMVTQLEEENAMLLKEEVELTKARYKQLMENLIPVVEKRKPPRPLRRVNSM